MRNIRGEPVQLDSDTGCAYGAHKGTPLPGHRRLQARGRRYTVTVGYSHKVAFGRPEPGGGRGVRPSAARGLAASRNGGAVHPALRALRMYAR
jgi:hypothetical protein